MKRGIVNPDLIEERANLAFDREELQRFSMGQFVYDKCSELDEFMEKNPELLGSGEEYEMTREELIEHHWKKIKIISEKGDQYITQNMDLMNKFWNWGSFLQSVSPLTLHQGMFTQSMYFLASEEQRQKYIPLCDNLQLFGCYAQTELGHGSNVQGLETTATLDLKADEWVIHTPTIRAAKFWPGGLGRTATHAVVFAKMLIDGNSFSVHPFLVPIRSLEDHRPLPGVEVGDIGTKLGYNSMDNGYLLFTNVRIPRENLLSRLAYVDAQGNFEARGDPRALYIIMQLTRISILQTCWLSMARSALISVRYAVCRRQFKTISSSNEERKLLDYQTHMAILGPHLAASYVALFLGKTLEDMVHKSNELIAQKGSYEMLEIIHHLSAGFKAYMTDYAYIAMDEMR